MQENKETSVKFLSPTERKSYLPECRAPHSAQEQSVQRQMKRNVRKNLAVVSGAFFLIYLAYNGLSNIQSSINPDGGMGTVSLCVNSAALVLSSLFIPNLLINKIGCKWTLVICPVLFGTFVAANFYPSWGTLIPTSILLGLAAAPLWSSLSTYINKIGKDYAFLTGERAEVVIGRFFGFFFMIMQFGQTIGNLISSLILKNENSNATVSQEQLTICGTNYCNQQLPYHQNITVPNDNSTMDIIIRRHIDINQIYMLCGIYLACTLLSSLLMTFFLDPLEKHTDETLGMELLMSTLKQMKDPKQLLLIPVTMYNGVQLGFMTGDVTKALITCPLGVDKVGYIMMCQYITTALGCMIWGIVVKITGRIPIYAFGAITMVSIIIVILYWIPEPQKLYVFFIISILWGMVESVFTTQNSSIYGVAFPNNLEAAYSNLRLWESIGQVITFGLSHHVCIYQKLYILISVLSISMFSYFSLEICFLRQRSA